MNEQEYEELMRLLRQYWPESGGQSSYARHEKMREQFIIALESSGWSSPSKLRAAVDDALDRVYTSKEIQ